VYGSSIVYLIVESVGKNTHGGNSVTATRNVWSPADRIVSPATSPSPARMVGTSGSTVCDLHPRIKQRRRFRVPSVRFYFLEEMWFRTRWKKSKPRTKRRKLPFATSFPSQSDATHQECPDAQVLSAWAHRIDPITVSIFVFFRFHHRATSSPLRRSRIGCMVVARTQNGLQDLI